MFSNNIRLAICPCDTDRNLKYWEGLKISLEKLFNQKFELMIFNDFKGEDLFLEKELERLAPELYFASPDTTMFLYFKNYVPLYRFCSEWDNFIFITHKRSRNSDKKKSLRVILPAKPFFYIALLLSSLSIEKTKIVFSQCFGDSIEKLIRNEGDLAILYHRYWNELLPQEKRDLKIVEVLPFIFYHYLLVRKDFYQKHRHTLNKIERLEPFIKIPSGEIENLKGQYEKIRFLLGYYYNKAVLDTIYNHPALFLAIYRDRFLSFNRGVPDYTGYSSEELYQLSPLDIVMPQDRSFISPIVNKRLKGIEESVFYPKIRILKKNGQIAYLTAFTQTISYEGRPAGLIIGIDKTQEEQLKIFNSILLDINHLIIHTQSEEELLEKICTTLEKNFDLKLVWTGIFEEDNIKIAFSSGAERDLPFTFLINYLLNEESVHPIFQSIKEGKISIIEDIKTASLSEEYKEVLLTKGLRSCAIIPFYKKGKPYGFLSLLSAFSLFFTEEIRQILEEIQQDISFALDKIDLVKEHQLLYNVIEQSREWIVITDVNGKILYTSPYVCELSGYKMEEILGQNPRIFKSGFHSKEFYTKLWETILSGNPFSTVIVNRAKDGSLFKLEEVIHPVRLPDGETRFIAIGKNITKEEYLLKEIEYFKFYDPLTGLYNFSTFIFKVNEELKLNKGISALILIDIQNLSVINYQHGIATGDEILKIIAERLKRALTKKDIIGRAGGDEFILFISHIPKVEIIHKVL
jgi:PAS domain S-box-containing protein